MYWIIVLLWITLAGWSLSFFNWTEVKSDVRLLYVSSYQGSLQIEQEYFGKVQNIDTEQSVREMRQQPVVVSTSIKSSSKFKKKTTKKKNQKAWLDITNKMAGFYLRIPAGWKYTERADDASITANAEPTSEYGTASLVAVEFGNVLSRKTFINHINADLKKEFPFMQSRGQQKSVKNSIIDSVTVYKGIYKGDQVTVFVGYKTTDRYGYAFIGTYDSRAIQTENLLYQILQTLKVDRR